MAKFADIKSLKKVKESVKDSKNVPKHPLAGLSMDVRMAYLGGLCFAALADDSELQDEERTTLSQYAVSLDMTVSDLEEAESTLSTTNDKVGYLRESLSVLTELKAALFFCCDAVKVMCADGRLTGEGREFLNVVLSALGIPEKYEKIVNGLIQYLSKEIKISQVSFMDNFQKGEDAVLEEVVGYFAAELIPTELPVIATETEYANGIYIVHTLITSKGESELQGIGIGNVKKVSIDNARMVMSRGDSLQLGAEIVEIRHSSFSLRGEPSSASSTPYFILSSADVLKLEDCFFDCGNVKTPVFNVAGRIESKSCVAYNVNASVSKCSIEQSYRNSVSDGMTDESGFYEGLVEICGGKHLFGHFTYFRSGVVIFRDVELHFKQLDEEEFRLPHFRFGALCSAAVFENCKITVDDNPLIKEAHSAEVLFESTNKNFRLVLRNCDVSYNVKLPQGGTYELSDYDIIFGDDPRFMRCFRIAGSALIENCSFANFRSSDNDEAVFQALNAEHSSIISIKRSKFIACSAVKNSIIYAASLEVQDCTFDGCVGKWSIVTFELGHRLTIERSKFHAITVTNENGWMINCVTLPGSPKSSGIGVDSSCAYDSHVPNNHWCNTLVKFVNWKLPQDVDALMDRAVTM